MSRVSVVRIESFCDSRYTRVLSLATKYTSRHEVRASRDNEQLSTQCYYQMQTWHKTIVCMEILCGCDTMRFILKYLLILCSKYLLNIEFDGFYQKQRQLKVTSI